MRRNERFRVAEKARIEGYHQAAEQFLNLLEQMQRTLDGAQGIARDLLRAVPSKDPWVIPPRLEDL